MVATDLYSIENKNNMEVNDYQWMSAKIAQQKKETHNARNW